MIILAIDTSSEFLSIAVTNDEKEIASYHRRAHMRHSARLIPVIDKVLKDSRLKISKVDGFAISIGPGSFTGLRIGVTTVKMLAFALNKPVVSVPTLDVIAENARDFTGTVCPTIDAKKNKVYVSLYRSDGEGLKRTSRYLLIEPHGLVKKIKKKTLFLGDGAEVYKDVIGQAKGAKFYKRAWHPRASIVARLALEKFRKKRYSNVFDLVPAYIYSKECDIRGR